MKVILAQPRGFCAGVVRAIEIVERALVKYGPPVYVRHEIVHNKHVVENLKAKGAVFVEELDEVPRGATVIFSAHGVAKKVEAEASERGLRVLAGRPVGEVARTFELDPERVKLLPAGILLLEETSTRLGLPLQIARGGLREGVILEMLGGPAVGG